jgi:hypothetical protein
MRNTLLGAACALMGVLACGSVASAAGNDAKVTLINKSQWAIHELYFSPTNATEWGDDQLGKQTIPNGGTFTLNGIPCNKYDVRLVDEDGDACVVEDVAVCANKDSWEITDKDLLGCQAKSK